MTNRYSSSRYINDSRRRRSVSYRFKRWFFSNHTKEIQKIFLLIGQFILAIMWFGAFIFVPHLFH
jgi:hypothetical protein